MSAAKSKLEREQLRGMVPQTIDGLFFVDVIHMPNSRGYRYIITARERVSSFLEASKLKRKTAAHWIDFVHREIICRYGVTTIVSDHGELDSNEMQAFCESFGIKFIPVSEYNPRANYVERGHLPFADGIMKSCAQLGKPWSSNEIFNAALWADRISINRSTGYSPYFLRYGKDCILPIELTILSWTATQLTKTWTDEELLANRIYQIGKHHLRVKESRESAQVVKEKNQIAFNKLKSTRKELLKLDDVVLLHNTRIEQSHSSKLDPFWIGPYRITKVYDGGYYKIAELNGAEYKDKVTGNRLVLFRSKSDLDLENLKTYIRYQDIEDNFEDNEIDVALENGLDLSSDGSAESNEEQLPIRVEIDSTWEPNRRTRRRLRRNGLKNEFGDIDATLKNTKTGLDGAYWSRFQNFTPTGK